MKIMVAQRGHVFNLIVCLLSDFTAYVLHCEATVLTTGVTLHFQINIFMCVAKHSLNREYLFCTYIRFFIAFS